MEVLNLYNVNPGNLLWINNKSYFVHVTQHMTRFYRNMCVNYINLGENAIAEIDSGTLFSMKNLTCLKSYILSENNFMIVYPAVPEFLQFFSQSINLEAFDYSYILIQMSSPISFSHPSSITGCLNKDVVEEEIAIHPFLPKSQDTSVVSNIVYHILCPQNLKILRCSHIIYPFRIFNNLIFRNCSHLDVIDISFSHISEFSFQAEGIENTSIVNLSGLDGFKMNKAFMRSFKNVKHLVMQNGNIDRAFSMGNYVLNELCDMNTLDISLNHLTELHPRSLCSEKHLRTINLSSNSFDQFPSILTKFKTLYLIDLTFNRISQINVSMTSWLDTQYHNGHAIRLLLKGNMFACTCDNVKFIQWVFEKRMDIPDKDEFDCIVGNGQRLKMKFVYKNLNSILGKCETDVLLKFGLFGVSFLGLALVASIICYRFRWRILYFFYRQCRTERPTNPNIFEFDAFVAYTGEDHTWACEILRNKLEDEHNLNLCLHERDFAIGESIAQNIVDFIRRSRTIIST